MIISESRPSTLNRRVLGAMPTAWRGHGSPGHAHAKPWAWHPTYPPITTGRSTTKSRAVLPWRLLLIFAVGCSDAKPGKPVFPVHGRLTYQNKPMGQARLAFLPVGDGIRGTSAQATTDEDGRYRLTTYRQGDGAPPGEYVVTVYWPAPPSASKGRAKADP